MEVRPFVVFADDLTGASASAGALAQALKKPVSVVDELPHRTERTYPLVLNTRSRENASRVVLVHQWAKRLWNDGVRDFEVRIDTTLRGHTPKELHELVSALPQSPWIGVVAAYPQAGRTTHQGRQFIQGQPVSEVVHVDTDEIGAYLFGPNAATLIVMSNPPMTSPVLEDRLLQVPGVVFDAGSDTDLLDIARLLIRLRRRHQGPWVTVSSGALLRYYPFLAQPQVAIVVGSPTKTNIDQVHTLAQHVPALVQPLDDPALPPSLPAVIVLHSGLTPLAFSARQPIHHALARAAVTHLRALSDRGWLPDRLIVTGGETAQAVLDSLAPSRVQWFDVHTLQAPLVGHGLLRGGSFHGVELITKGGLVGDAALLYQLTFTPLLASRWPTGSLVR